MALVEVENLTKVFLSGESAFSKRNVEVRAVDDVSLQIYSGETLGLVGESGSGKSTLGRLILRLIEPTSGNVHFEGHDLLRAARGELRNLRCDMQIIFQDPFGSLDPRMRIADLIAEPLMIHRQDESTRPQAKTRVAELLRVVGLDASAMQRYPHEWADLSVHLAFHADCALSLHTDCGDVSREDS